MVKERREEGRRTGERWLETPNEVKIGGRKKDEARSKEAEMKWRRGQRSVSSYHLILFSCHLANIQR